jgi:hypothetical protein
LADDGPRASRSKDGPAGRLTLGDRTPRSGAHAVKIIYFRAGGVRRTIADRGPLHPSAFEYRTDFIVEIAMNLPDGRRPRYMRPVAEQPQLTFVEFLQSTDMTCLLAASCVAIGAMIVLCAASRPAASGVHSIATAMAFG